MGFHTLRRLSSGLLLPRRNESSGLFAFCNQIQQKAYGFDSVNIYVFLGIINFFLPIVAKFIDIQHGHRSLGQKVVYVHDNLPRSNDL